MLAHHISLPRQVPSFKQTPIGAEGKLPHFESLRQFITTFLTSRSTRAALSGAQKLDLLRQCQIACKLATKVIQEGKNQGGQVPHISLNYYGSLTNPDAIELFHLLTSVGNSASEAIPTPAQDLNILCKHRLRPCCNRKLSFFGTNYTNHAQKFRDFIDEELGFTAEDYPISARPLSEEDLIAEFLPVPNEIGVKILSQLSQPADRCNVRLVNFRANLLSLLAQDPLKYLTINPTIIQNKGKFEEFLSYLASNECRITSLNLRGIKLHGKPIAKLFKALVVNQSITSLNLSNCGLSDDDVKNIAELKNLSSLNIAFNSLGVTGAMYISLLINLTSLDISANIIENTGVMYISGLSELVNLNVSGNQLDCRGVAYLINHKHLTSLNIAINDIGDTGAKRLSDLKSLVNLNISSNALTHIGAKYIAKLTRLTELDISLNRLYDAGAEDIAKLINLQNLDISSSFITDKGALRIITLPKLLRLNIKGNCIEGGTVSALKASPSCVVSL
ncbi:MAG: hypothetical protein ACK4M7_02215 [Burkholderiales bacterium]